MSTTRTGSNSNGRAFYAPATSQFSSAPGRVERAVTLFRQRGAMDGHPRTEGSEYAFYAPATTHDAVGRGRRPNAR